MAYLGQGAEGNFTTTNAKDTFSGDGSETTFTLSQRGTENNVDVFVNNVRQEPGVAYNIEGNGTSLVFTAAPSTGTNNIYVVNRGPAELSASHPASQNLEAADGTFTGDLTVDTNTLYVDSTNNRVGIGTTSPVTPLEIETTNKLGSTFTGTTNGEGLTVTQTNYTAGNYISLVEAAYDDSNDANPNVRIGVMFDGGGSNLAFGTSNSYGSGITNTAMFIDSVANVGIGTTSPSYSLDIQGATNGDITQRIKNSTAGTSARAGLYVDADDGNKGNLLATSSAYTGVGSWQDATVLNAGSIASGGLILNAQGGDIKFQKALAEKVRITSNGLTFNGDTAAANALDDYEEGTWTPNLNGFTGSFTHQRGRYIKIGAMVYASFHLDVSSTGGSGNLILTNLPFTAANSSNDYGGVTTMHCNGWASTTKPDNGLVYPNATTVTFFKSQGTVGTSFITIANLGTGNFLGVLVYEST